ncbi:MAG: hypothetical protein KC615_09300 [Anaerolineae bacterium]|nr:hypothetical protein [Anaerolineae bacterium]MCA9893168.1 hypothetical protein [Anaerolineae bacterium]MCB9461236.1 hypothetical protein [Anaerolineaceae bacterium]
MNLDTMGGKLAAGMAASFVIWLIVLVVGQPELAIAAMLAIIIVAFWVVVAVMFYGAQEDVSAHGSTADESPSVRAWNERADRLDARQKEATEGADS